MLVGSPSSYTVTLTWPVTPGNAYAVDYYRVDYVDLFAPVPAWTTVQCDNLGDGFVSDWHVLGVFCKLRHVHAAWCQRHRCSDSR